MQQCVASLKLPKKAPKYPSHFIRKLYKYFTVFLVSYCAEDAILVWLNDYFVALNRGMRRAPYGEEEEAEEEAEEEVLVHRDKGRVEIGEMWRDDEEFA